MRGYQIKFTYITGTSAVLMIWVGLGKLFDQVPSVPIPPSIPYQYGLVGITLTLILLFSAFAFHKASNKFDIIVAAETIIAFGIFSLIIGLLTALAIGREGLILDKGVISAQPIKEIVTAFLEGLFVSALAPICAVILRNYASDQSVGVDSIEMSALDKASRELTSSMKRAAAEIGNLSDKAVSGGDALVTSLSKASQAAVNLAYDCEAKLGAVSGSMENLSTTMKSVDVSAEKSSKALSTVAEHLIKLKDSTHEATQMLEALSTVIEKIERFTTKHRAA